MVVAGTVLAVSLAGVLARPWRVPDWALAVAGAALLVALGREPPGAALDVLWSLGPVAALLAGVLLLAALAEDAGLHAAGAALVVRGARGSPLRLVVGVAALTFVATALFSLDGAVLALTPLLAMAVVGAGAAAEPSS